MQLRVTVIGQEERIMIMSLKNLKGQIKALRAQGAKVKAVNFPRREFRIDQDNKRMFLKVRLVERGA